LDASVDSRVNAFAREHSGLLSQTFKTLWRAVFTIR
jgi:hypothetical protein